MNTGLKMSNTNKVTLFTGICGSGKTTCANELATSLGTTAWCYDKHYNYPNQQLNTQGLKETIVIDAWSIYDDPDLSFLRACVGDEKGIEIIYLYATPLQIYESQLEKRKNGLKLTNCQLAFDAGPRAIAAEMQTFLGSHLARRVQFVKRNSRIVTKPGAVREALHTDPKKELLSWIDERSGDPRYQDIEVQDQKLRSGYLDSEATWREILKLGIANFIYKRSVADLGCFNGYFSIQMAKLGAKVTAYDNNVAAQSIVERLALLNLVDVKVVSQDLSKKGLDSQFDIVLLLGSYHHIVSGLTDEESLNFLTLLQTRCNNDLIATINADDLEEFKAAMYFNLVSETPIHPKGASGPRMLLHYKRHHPKVIVKLNE